jgi:hypothetical protein
MKVSTVDLTLRSLSPYSQSRFHEELWLKGELPGDYDKRTWRSHLHTDANGIVVIPETGIMQAMTAGAKYSKKQIKGQGKATWTAKFRSGIAVQDTISTGIHADSVGYDDIYANSDGVRGSGKRVMRRFPVIHEWQSTFPVTIIDPIITDNIFEEIVNLTGMFIGIGRYRPENGGSNGRFSIVNMVWHENREFEPKTRG